MAHIYSKGWFIQQLKAVNISKIDGRKLESYKTYILRNLYAELIEQGKING
ncbi:MULTISPECIES: YflJ family protein [Priestia]|uniref:YflJ family protein n=1 Tax=Priestia TaxID=2800373 RepID=UPI0009B9B7AA|nr:MULTISPECIES: YflJ family protein [Priestia]MBU3573953.1 YflJ family protein [Priestia aryabhattai]MBX4162321.1 YflJ family protein [Priestia megaterium]MED3897333.1 YflJ family protein [Priestia aryabhattai]WDL86920.1 YflJ family protein [Priestia aryabhattai]